MPSGRVKVFSTKKKYGFLVNDDNGRDVYVNASQAPNGTLTSGDLVEFELDTEGDKPQAKAVKVTRKAPEGNLVGRVMHEPPSYDELESRERERRMARRRRR